MADEPITPSISQDSIQEIVRTRIRAELLEALGKNGGAEKLLAGLVSEALQRRVSRSGYSRDEKPFIVDLVEQAIHEETRRAFTEWLSENRDTIKNAMLAAIRKDKSLPVRILTSLLEHAANQYRCEIKIQDVQR